MRKVTILAALLFLSVIGFGQSNDEEALKKVTQAELDAITSRNVEGYKAVWLQDANAFFANFSPYGTYMKRGWDSIYTPLQKEWTANSKSDIQQVKLGNYNVRSNGNMAWVDYDALLTPVNSQADMFPYGDAVHLHDYDLYVKENDQWKLASQVITTPQNNDANTDHIVESDLNTTGYKLLSAKKYNQAIEVFKLNVQLYPNSWNVYDSLGEAYAAAGNKKLAMENYEKSIKLNPKSTTGP